MGNWDQFANGLRLWLGCERNAAFDPAQQLGDRFVREILRGSTQALQTGVNQTGCSSAFTTQSVSETIRADGIKL
jgi:hypothetical protein